MHYKLLKQRKLLKQADALTISTVSFLNHMKIYKNERRCARKLLPHDDGAKINKTGGAAWS